MEGVTPNQVENHDLSADTYNGEQIDHYNIDNATVAPVLNAIMSIFQSLKSGETKTLTADDLKKMIKQ